MYRYAIIVSTLLIASAAGAVKPYPSDLRDYAFSSCLIKQTGSKYLRDQGYLIGQMQINKFDSTEFFSWKPIGEAVEAELKSQPAFEVRTDGPVSNPTSPAPVAQCLSILDASRVRTAIAKIEARWKRR